MTYHRVSDKNNPTGATDEAGTATNVTFPEHMSSHMVLSRVDIIQLLELHMYSAF
jgi:hypothetical protein